MLNPRVRALLVPLLATALAAGAAAAGEWQGYTPGRTGTLGAAVARHLEQVPAAIRNDPQALAEHLAGDPLVREMYEQYLYQGSRAGPLSIQEFAAAWAATSGFIPRPRAGSGGDARPVPSLSGFSAPAGTTFLDADGRTYRLDSGRPGVPFEAGEAFYAPRAGR